MPRRAPSAAGVSFSATVAAIIASRCSPREAFLFSDPEALQSSGRHSRVEHALCTEQRALSICRCPAAPGSQVLLDGAGLVREQARSAASDRDSKGSPPRRHSASHQRRPRLPGAPSAPCPPGSEQGYLGFKLVQRGEFTGFEGTGAVDLVEVVGCEDQPQHRTLERPRVKPAPRPGRRARRARTRSRTPRKRFRAGGRSTLL